MDPGIVIALGTIVAAFIVVMFARLRHRRRSRRIQQLFGAEYDRVVLEQQGDSHRAEAVLADREKRVRSYSLRALSPLERMACWTEWMTVQRCSVDNLFDAVSRAERLIVRAMTDRGYPQSDFEQRSADISVSYPSVVQSYRSAHEIVARHGDGQATTEDLQQAMVYYRSLIYELLGPSADELARDELLDPVWDEMYDTSGSEPVSDGLLEPAASKPASDVLLYPAANELLETTNIEMIDAKRRRATGEHAS